VIAKPDSSTPTTEPTAATTPADASPLSSNELYQLTLYKWRYSLEAYGFEPHQIHDLMFLKWLHATRRVLP
jgi:hypothetical protein